MEGSCYGLVLGVVTSSCGCLRRGPPTEKDKLCAAHPFVPISNTKSGALGEWEHIYILYASLRNFFRCGSHPGGEANGSESLWPPHKHAKNTIIFCARSRKFAIRKNSAICIIISLVLCQFYGEKVCNFRVSVCFLFRCDVHYYNLGIIMRNEMCRV